ncbi:MAG TPA: NmrA family NAD(P)-binding protein [Acidobacteriota bacterium]|nr:NmrA family NAD(P)-binding protein [Acidobacteriota bacterium]
MRGIRPRAIHKVSRDFHFMNKVLVTGASGFIGSHVVEVVAACGIPVRAHVRSKS